jgi:hypothetical protein
MLPSPDAIMLVPKQAKGLTMKSREEYLQLATEAEVYEKKATDRNIRAAWEKIVVGYLELAEIAEPSTQRLQCA